MIEEFADTRQPGECLFATSSGKPLEPSYVREYIMLPNSIPGIHSLRRFRSTRCEEQGTPRSLLDQWIAHSNGNVTDRYIKSAEDREFRRKQVERIGTGLNLFDALVSQITNSGTHHDKATKKPGTRKDPSAEIVVKRSLVRRNPVLSAPDVVEAPTSPRYVASDEDLPETFSTPAMGTDEV